MVIRKHCRTLAGRSKRSSRYTLARHSRRSNQVAHFELSTQVAHSAPLSTLAGCNQITGFEGRDLKRTDLTRKHLKRTDLVPSAADSIIPGRSHHLNYSSLII